MTFRVWIARIAVVMLAATVLVPGAQVEVWATPLTLVETLDELEEADASGSGDRSRSDVIETPISFSAVGFEAPAAVDSIRVRTSADGVEFSPWDPMDFMDAEDGPDEGSVESASQATGKHTEPLWVGEASYLQVEVTGGSVATLSTSLIDSMGLSGGPVQREVQASIPEASASGLNIISRAQWGANELLTKKAPSIASQVHMGVVHHTAHASTAVANSYTREQAAGLVRSFHAYHTTSLGWNDIGYNALVDRFGRIYEGRKGGFDRGVIGAHAAGYNTGSFGVAVIGNFVQTQAPAAAIASLTDVIGVKAAIHGINPAGWTDRMSGTAWRPTVIGHKDVGQTACPGLIHDLLPTIRSNARGYSAPTPAPVIDDRFPDVPLGSPHRPAILSLADAGVTTGCRENAYCPSETLQRAQVSSFVARAFDVPPAPGVAFPDVSTSSVHAGSIKALTQRGWIAGYSNGRFGPSDTLTRGQLATVLARSLELPMPRPATDPYPDVSRHSTHAPALAALRDVGIQGNCGSGNFCATDPALRDSTASFIQMARSVRSAR